MNPSPEPAVDPRAARSAAELVDCLRRLRARTGLSYREVERCAELNGDFVPYSTVFHMLHRPRLPREEMLAAFVRACGCPPEEVAVWLDVRGRLAESEAADWRSDCCPCGLENDSMPSLPDRAGSTQGEPIRIRLSGYGVRVLVTVEGDACSCQVWTELPVHRPHRGPDNGR